MGAPKEDTVCLHSKVTLNKGAQEAMGDHRGATVCHHREDIMEVNTEKIGLVKYDLFNRYYL